MPAQKLTKSTIAKLACPAGKAEAFYWDAELPGFGVRCLASGRRVWVVQYRTRVGRARRMVVGDVRALGLDAARGEARRILAAVSLDGDPQGERKAQRAAETVAEMVKAYLPVAKRRLRASTYSAVERYLMRHARALHPLKAEEVTRRDVVAMLARVLEGSGPVAANRCRAHLSALWTWGIRSGWIEGANPVAGSQVPAVEVSRDRVLTDAELALVWRCTGAGDEHDRIVRLLMLTGARRGEMGGMRWSELVMHDDGAATWVVPADRSKNRTPMEFWLSPLAVSQLPARRAENDRVFGLKGSGYRGWGKPKERLDVRMAAVAAQAVEEGHGRAPVGNEGAVTTWRLHDLRRTFATGCHELGIEPHVVEECLGHVSGLARRGVAGVYNRASYRAAKQKAWAWWETHVKKLVGDLPNSDAY